MSLFLHSDVHNMNRKTVENIILGITNDLLGEWKDKFKTISVYADNPILRDNGMTSDYFSEIEVNFLYEDHSFADVFSIIVFMQNEQVLKENEAKAYIQAEIACVYNECIENRQIKKRENEDSCCSYDSAIE